MSSFLAAGAFWKELEVKKETEKKKEVFLYSWGDGDVAGGVSPDWSVGDSVSLDCLAEVDDSASWAQLWGKLADTDVLISGIGSQDKLEADVSTRLGETGASVAEQSTSEADVSTRLDGRVVAMRCSTQALANTNMSEAAESSRLDSLVANEYSTQLLVNTKMSEAADVSRLDSSVLSEAAVSTRVDIIDVAMKDSTQLQVNTNVSEAADSSRLDSFVAKGHSTQLQLLAKSNMSEAAEVSRLDSWVTSEAAVATRLDLPDIDATCQTDEFDGFEVASSFKPDVFEYERTDDDVYCDWIHDLIDTCVFKFGGPSLCDDEERYDQLMELGYEAISQFEPDSICFAEGKFVEAILQKLKRSCDAQADSAGLNHVGSCKTRGKKRAGVQVKERLSRIDERKSI